MDQVSICDRPKLNIPPPKDGKKWKKPAAEFVLKKHQRKEVLEWFQTLMFPDGYAANLSRGVNLSTMRINAKDLELLERLQLGDDNEDEIPPLEHGLNFSTCVIVMMRHMIQLIPMKMIISNTCMIRTN